MENVVKEQYPFIPMAEVMTVSVKWCDTNDSNQCFTPKGQLIETAMIIVAIGVIRRNTSAIISRDFRHVMSLTNIQISDDEGISRATLHPGIQNTALISREYALVNHHRSTAIVPSSVLRHNIQDFSPPDRFPFSRHLRIGIVSFCPA
jgi:hypothetical protein